MLRSGSELLPAALTSLMSAHDPIPVKCGAAPTERCANSGHSLLASEITRWVDFATSRAHFIKCSTTGLNVRFFNVTIAIGQCNPGNLMGNIFSKCRLASRRSTDRGSTVMKEPVASKLVRR